jgi:hypothetical protein
MTSKAGFLVGACLESGEAAQQIYSWEAVLPRLGQEKDLLAM